MRFVNVRSLDLDQFENIGDEYLAALCKLSKLTILDVTRDIDFHFGFYTSRNITEMGMHSLGSLSALKELYLESGVNVTNIWGYDICRPWPPSQSSYWNCVITFQMRVQSTEGVWWAWGTSVCIIAKCSKVWGCSMQHHCHHSLRFLSTIFLGSRMMEQGTGECEVLEGPQIDWLHEDHRCWSEELSTLDFSHSAFFVLLYWDLRRGR